MSIRKFAVAETGTLHLTDANGNLMYADDDETLPMELILHSKGSKAFAAAQHQRINALMAAGSSRGGKNKKLDPEEADRIRVDFLVRCTAGSNNIELDGLQGTALYRAIYSDPGLGFITDQVDEFLGSWGNFTNNGETS